jgi:hypothetical protein
MLISHHEFPSAHLDLLASTFYWLHSLVSRSLSRRRQYTSSAPSDCYITCIHDLVLCLNILIRSLLSVVLSISPVLMMNRNMVFLLFSLGLLSSANCAAGSATTVNLGYASVSVNSLNCTSEYGSRMLSSCLTRLQYQGVLNETTHLISFLGIRYAAAPEGDLRWRAPQAPPNISGVQSSDTQPDQCFQAQFGAAASNPLRDFQLSGGDLSSKIRRAVSNQSEDCLFLK